MISDDHGVDICIIEDDDAERRLLVERLRAFQYTVVEADCGASGLRAVYRYRPRVLICDVQLPGIDGIQICRHVRADPTLDGTYILVVTAHDRAGRKKTALNAGADDYINKPCDVEELLARIRNGLRFHRLQARLQHAALTDGLTELWNHMHFRELLDREFQRTRRYGGTVSLLMVDIDHFKAVNDTYGHEVGNQVLKLISRHIKRAIRDIDIAARYGGEEFAVICPATNLHEATHLADRLRRSIPQDVRLPQYPNLSVHASVGVASTEDPRVGSIVDLINLGDQALYQSKTGGRNRVTRCDELDDADTETGVHMDEVHRLRKQVVALNMQMKDLCLQSVWALIQALETRDGYSAWHSRNVTLYTKWLVEAAALAPSLRHATINAAMLHDLGKIGVPDRILLSTQSLDAEDAAIMRQVPQLTCKILEPLRVFETEALIIRHMRERYDGRGYPDALTGASIPIGSRILALTEAFDSLTCDRAHRPARSIDEALQVLLDEKGEHFDPELTDLLVRTVRSQRKRWQSQVDRAQVRLPQVV